MLTSDQVLHYHENGYTVPDYRLSDEVLADIRSDHARLISRNPQFRNYCPNLLAHDLCFLNYARIPKILDMVEQILGSDLHFGIPAFLQNRPVTGRRPPGIRMASIGPYAHWPLAPYGWQSIRQRWTMGVSDLSQVLISNRCYGNIRSTQAPT